MKISKNLADITHLSQPDGASVEILDIEDDRSCLDLASATRRVGLATVLTISGLLGRSAKGRECFVEVVGLLFPAVACAECVIQFGAHHDKRWA